MDKLIKDIETTLSFLEKNGHSATVRTTRQLIDRKGHIQALTDLMQTSQVQAGFTKLALLNRLDLTFESLIVHHSDLFDEDTVKRANKRMQKK